MTGFGKGVVKSGDFVVESEVKSVNSRFLDISVKLPKSVSDKEFEIREIIRKKVKRGKISLNIYIKKDELSTKNFFVDPDSLKGVVAMLKEIKKKSDAKGKIELSSVLSFSNMYISDSFLDPEKDFNLLVESVNASLEDLKQTRLREGTELYNDLKERLNIIADTVNKITQGGRGYVEEYFKKLRERAKELFENITDQNDRLNAELALLAEKYDVTEECVRLNSHIKLFRDTLENGDEAGRRLNFITQEMNREINTINSKTVSTEISHYGISVKEELEKIREQIQNIE